MNTSTAEYVVQNASQANRSLLIGNNSVNNASFAMNNSMFISGAQTGNANDISTLFHVIIVPAIISAYFIKNLVFYT